MNVLWSYFWPLLGFGLLVGAIAGLIAFRVPLRTKDQPADAKPRPSGRRRRRVLSLAAGVASSLAGAALWHGPLGGADRFTTHVERTAREALDHYEMTQITAHLHRGPLARRLILSGPADDFQHSELARLMSQLPGVSGATWSDAGAPIPLTAEGAGASLLGFLIGLLLAYLIELRRRYNAQWTW